MREPQNFEMSAWYFLFEKSTSELCWFHMVQTWPIHPLLKGIQNGRKRIKLGSVI